MFALNIISEWWRQWKSIIHITTENINIYRIARFDDERKIKHLISILASVLQSESCIVCVYYGRIYANIDCVDVPVRNAYDSHLHGGKVLHFILNFNWNSALTNI